LFCIRGQNFFGGHSDTTVGIVCVRTEVLAKEIAFYQNAEGSGLAPFECWLTLRGTKTMALRLERAQENAKKVVEFLSTHPMVTCVHYAGLPPQKEALNWQSYDRNYDTRYNEYVLHHQQAKGGGVLLSFTTKDVEISEMFINALRLFKITVSFGSCNSLVEMPCLLSHASIPADKRTLPASLVRMSIGIENIEDILQDVKQAFNVVQEKLKCSPENTV